jgi:nitrite reductase/ring-hydroxylating ferredoxin subunit
LSVFSKILFRKIILLLLLLFSSCGKEEVVRNPYLNNINFNININLNLPAYDNLRYPSGGVRVAQGGMNGLVLFNLNGDTILAWEATCPNHAVRNCSKLTITGVLAECSCEGFQYSMTTGQLLNPDAATENPYTMLFYPVRRSGNSLSISN